MPNYFQSSSGYPTRYPNDINPRTGLAEPNTVPPLSLSIGQPTAVPAPQYAPQVGPPLPRYSSPSPVVAARPTTPTNTLAQINQAIPGFSGLSEKATQRISDLMAGKVPNDVNNVIQTNRAQQAVSSGMPGSSRIQGTLQGNATLRDLGLTSLQAGQQGFNDLLSMLGSYSGSVVPTANASLGADVAREGQQNQVAMQNAQLSQAAAQFQQNFGLAEKQLAQQLGISEQDLALRLASLQSSTNLEQQRINQAASQFAQSRELGPRDIAQLSSASFLPQGTLASLLAKYGVGGGNGVGQLAVTGAGMSASTIGRY